MNTISFSPAAAQLIGGFEGFSASPYPDPVSHTEPITIAYGSTHYCNGTKVTMSDPPVTTQQGENMITCFLNNHVLPDFQQHITVSLSQNEIDALGSLVYNIGDINFDKSNLLKEVNQHIVDGTLKPFWITWDHANSKVIPGLLDRRTKEFNYFMTGSLS